MNKLLRLIETYLQTKKPLILAIDGPAASGKSTLSNELSHFYTTTIIRMDDFFLPPHLKTEERLSQIGGNIHYERFKDQILDQLKNIPFSYERYNCQTNELSDVFVKEFTELIIIEGSYSMHQELREYYDLKILLDVSRETQLRRLEERNPKLLQRFIDEWIPLEDQYFEAEELEKIADYILEL